MKDGKYSVMIVEDQQMPKALFSHFVESSDKFYLQVAIENASVADIVCTRTPVDLILMDVVTENGESGLEAAAKIKAKFPKTKIIVVTSMPECSYIKRAKQIGVEGFWYKEVGEQPILSLMERVMNGEIVYPDSPQPVRMGLALSTEFTEKELEIFKRGRNHITHIPKNGDLLSYQTASGLEAICGYLYLCDKERLEALFKEIFAGGLANE